MTNASFQAAKGNEEMLKLRPQKISRQTWIKGGNSSQKFIFLLSPYSYFITLFNYSWKIIEIRGDKFSEANSQRVICFNFQKRSRRRGFQFGMESGRKLQIFPNLWNLLQNETFLDNFKTVWPGDEKVSELQKWHQFWPKQKYIKVMVGHAKRGETGDDLSHLFCDKRVVSSEASNPCLLSSLHIIEQLLE